MPIRDRNAGPVKVLLPLPSPGEHWLKFRNPGFRTVNQRVVVRDGETQIIEIDLTAGAEATPVLPPEPEPAP